MKKWFYILFFVLIWALFLLLIMNFFVMPWYTRQGEELQMPDVTLMPLDSAEMVLADVGLHPVLEDSIYDDEIEKGKVVLQKPTPFSKVKKNRNVYLTISRGPKISLMPNFKGMTLRDARLKLQSIGLKEGWIQYKITDDYPEGVIFDQIPKPGERFSNLQTVNFYVSLGQNKKNIRLPKLVGMSLVAAKNKLLELKIRNIRIIYQKTENLLPGTIIEQSPPPNTPIIEVKEVQLTVSQ